MKKLLVAALTLVNIIFVSNAASAASLPQPVERLSLVQRECGSDDIHLTKNTPAVATMCTWKQSAEINDSAMQFTLYFDDTIVDYAKVNCTFSPARGSKDQIRAVYGYKAAAFNNIKHINIGPLDTTSQSQIITFDIENPKMIMANVKAENLDTENANIVFGTTLWATKWFYDSSFGTWVSGSSYTNGSQLSCNITPVEGLLFTAIY